MEPLKSAAVMKKSFQSTRVLLIEDNPGDARLIREMLAEAHGTSFKLTRVDQLSAGLKSFVEEGSDVILLDLGLPDSQGLGTFDTLHAHAPDTPILVLTGLADETIGFAAVKAGAQDYLNKGRIDSYFLGRAIRYAIERKQVETALKNAQKENQLLVDLLENAQDEMIFVVQLDGQIIRYNGLAKTVFGYSEINMQAQNIHTLFRSETENGWDKVAESIARQARWRGDLLAVCKDGTTFPVIISISKSINDASERESMICFVRDVTQEREVDRMKSEFIAIASHELRTPLTSIKNAVDLILTKKTGDITANQEKFLSMAQRNINRLNTLINDLLNIGKIEAGKMELHLAEMDIQEVVEKTLTMLKSLADEKSLSFQMRMAPHLPGVYADAARIEEVLINLLGNAIKFTPENGAITVDAHPAQTASEMPAGGQDFVEISISDTGIGMSENSRKHLFEKFYQVESSLSTAKRSGTGLGLAISQEIVKLHGGVIRCKSKEGEGTTFNVLLPVASKKKIFYHALDQEIAKARQQRTALAILLIEIQDFDRLVEVWGQEASAKVVATVEEKIQGGIRGEDQVYSSVFNSEFLLILPATKREQAQIALNRHQQLICGNEIVVARKGYTLAFIASIATFPEDGISADELVTFARKHLA